MFDLIIIGAGPAGITASVYAARKRMELLVITKDIGGQAAVSGDVENYTGYQFITGFELAAKFEEHMRKYGIQVKEGEEVTELSAASRLAVGSPRLMRRDLASGGKKKKDVVKIRTNKDEYEAKTAIIASGKRSKELGVPGEKEFRNRGLTYCATCDGPLFSGKDVAIIGGGNSSLDAALQMINIAKQIYIINVTPQLSGDAIMQEKVKASKKVSILNNARVTAILGDKMVKGIELKIAKTEKILPVEGVFVEIGLVPNSEFVIGLEKNESGEIKVNSYNETNIPGIFAAGDVTDVPEKQIIIAAGEGSKAALGAFRYLAQHR
jgi:alkyl hydroperoxide reductase subunit F